MEVTPEDVIRNFTINLDCGSWNREGKDKAKEHLINYFIECGYSQHQIFPDIVQHLIME